LIIPKFEELLKNQRRDSRNLFEINWRRNPKMNSKVRAPRLQETHVFVTQKSKSNQDGTQHGILQERDERRSETKRRNMEKESENKKFKTGSQISLTSTTHWRLQRRLHKEALILNHAKETLEEDEERRRR
jgi:hypothetical protein